MPNEKQKENNKKKFRNMELILHKFNDMLGFKNTSKTKQTFEISKPIAFIKYK